MSALQTQLGKIKAMTPKTTDLGLISHWVSKRLTAGFSWTISDLYRTEIKKKEILPPSLINHRIIVYLKLEGTHRDHQGQTPAPHGIT